MAVRTRRLGDASVLTAGAGATTTIFTVPADRTAIVKRVRGWLAATTAAFPILVNVLVLKADTTTRTIAQLRADAVGMMYLAPFDGVSTQEWWDVLHEGDALRFSQPANCTIQMYVSGTLLSGDPA